MNGEGNKDGALQGDKWSCIWGPYKYGEITPVPHLYIYILLALYKGLFHSTYNDRRGPPCTSYKWSDTSPINGRR